MGAMKAVYINRHGGPEVLEFGDMPAPLAKTGEVLVDIHAASINAADWKVRTGSDYPVSTFPYILGRDFSGVVGFVAQGVTDIRAGDRVFGVCDVGQEGAYAEQIAVKSAIIAKIPVSISHIDAAAVALTGLTALVAVEDTLQLRSGETILIQGGAGGVASFAIQLAKHIGARVITTASANNHNYLRQLGADQIVDYHTQDFMTVISGCDAVFDTVGGDVAQRSFAVLKPGGRAAFIASGAQAPKPPRADVTSLRPKVGRDRAHLERVVELMKAGVVRKPEVKQFRLADAAAAHELSQSRHLRGKLVFKVQ
jgi:NADPH:quinone reductase-like Zn-dependent oxidoreductase